MDGCDTDWATGLTRRERSNFGEPSKRSLLGDALFATSGRIWRQAVILFAKPFAIGQIVTAVSQLLNAGGPAVGE